MKAITKIRMSSIMEDIDQNPRLFLQLWILSKNFGELYVYWLSVAGEEKGLISAKDYNFLHFKKCAIVTILDFFISAKILIAPMCGSKFKPEIILFDNLPGFLQTAVVKVLRPQEGHKHNDN